MPPRSRGPSTLEAPQSGPKSTSRLSDAAKHGNHSVVPSNGLPAAMIEQGDGAKDGDTLASRDLESSEPDEEAEVLSTSQPLRTSRSHSHLPPHTASALYPPFYNRPPTPLLPSPSLTSLLRPPFASKPTTPDSSDVEPSGGLKVPHNGSGTSTAASSTANLASSARLASTVPRAAPKVPTYEYYGFAVYLGSSAAFLMYILWAYVPAPMLHQMGIYYYPNRWWALAIPCWLIALIIFIYVALASYNTEHLTLPLNSIENMVDECAQIAVVDGKTCKIVRDPVLVTDKLHEKDKEKGTRAGASRNRRTSFSAYQFRASDDVEWIEFWNTGTDAVMDVPIGAVCEILYGSD